MVARMDDSPVGGRADCMVDDLASHVADVWVLHRVDSKVGTMVVRLVQPQVARWVSWMGKWKVLWMVVMSVVWWAALWGETMA